MAGLETLLALRALLGGTVEIELLAAEPEFTYRPIAVAEPFGLGEVRQIELARIASEHDAHLRHASARQPSTRRRRWCGPIAGRSFRTTFWSWPSARVQRPALDGALTFGGSEDRDRSRT